ncbi:MAG: deoxyribonuclease IV [bacterium]
MAASDAGATMPIGPHVSVAGELANAIANGERVGATCIQIFTRNQRTWKAKPLAEEEVANFRAARESSPIGEVMSHDSYLINLGSPEEEKLGKSREAFFDEAARCAELGIRLLNFHPGAHMGGGRDACLERIVEGVRAVMERLPEAGVVYTIENTAGQGSAVGETLEDLARLLEGLDAPGRSGVCLDTCHLFAAGYDLTDEQAYGRFWEEFERRIGFSYLKAFHLNDAKKPLGSRVDRHENLGRGEMGEAVFRRLAQDPRFFDIPMFLETPGEDEAWRAEIALMRGFRGQGGAA